jgi:hypothetical protein
MLREFQAARRVRTNAEAKREEERQLEDCGGGDSRIGQLLQASCQWLSGGTARAMG